MSWLSTRGYAVACAVFVVAWLLLSAPWLSGAVTIPYDAKAHFQAQLQFLAQAIHSGQSPFWAPNVFAGSPQIADPQSLIFSPLLLLALITSDPSFRAVDTTILLTLCAGGLGVIGFFRDRGWHPAGAVVAALAFAFGASAAWRIQHVGQIESYAFFGVTSLLLGRALDRGSILWGAAAGAAAGLMLVKPDQVAFLASFILAGYVLDHLARNGRVIANIRAAAPALISASLVGAAIVIVPVLMTYLFASESNRPEFSFADAGAGSLHPAELLTAVVGDLFGAKDPNVDFWGPSSSSWNPGEVTLSQNMGQMYVGAVPVLALIVLGLARGYAFARGARLWLAAIVLMTLYALGWYTPVFQLFFDYVPGVNAFRRPADATFMLGASIAILGGYCVHRLMSDEKLRLAIRSDVAAGCAIAALFAIAIGVGARLNHLAVAALPIFTALMWFAAAAALLLVARHLRGRAAALAVAIPAALLAVDLHANNGPNESTALPPSAYDILDPHTKNETIRFLKERLAQHGPSDRRDRVELVGLGFAWPNAGLVHGFDHTLGYNPLRLAEFADATGAGDTIAGPDQKQFTRAFPRYNCRLANLLGLRYIVSGVPIEQVDPQYRSGDLIFLKRTTDGYIYENPRSRPRVMFAQNWRLADFDQIVDTGRWPEFDPAKTVLLESDPSAEHPHIISPGASHIVASVQDLSEMASAVFPDAVTAPSHVLITRYENTEIEISVDAAQAGFVVLNDVWHPWWKATLDDKDAPILKANVLFRAVQVPEGKHTLRFSFKPIEGAIAELGAKLKEDE
ncbi:hypothetical protein [Terrarubrum flagellatum]|uniref:hypothetical protein n=1 Tax=Terrirubrum flagellatum TaxID=2895980 RepID=UPI003144E24C